MPTFLLCCCLSLCSLTLSAEQTAQVQILMHESITVAHEAVTVADLATLSGDEHILAGIRDAVVQRAPDAGLRTVSKQQLRAIVRKHAHGASLSITGQACTITRRLKIYTETEIAELVRPYVEQQLLPDAQNTIRLKRVSGKISVLRDDVHPVTLVVEPISAAQWGDIPFVLKAQHQDRTIARSLVVYHVDAHRTVYTATQHIRHGERISLDDLQPQHIAITNTGFAQAPTPEALIGTIARSDITVGTVVTWNIVRNPPLVRGGARVALVIENDGFILSVDGTALGDGAEGETISIRTDRGKHIVRAQVTGPGTASVIQ